MLYFILARPKFMFYSLVMHLIGTIEAYKQNNHIDWYIFILFQFTITITHIMTHFYNEYGDYEADKQNKKDGTWTGGSKILKHNKLHKNVALQLGIIFTILSIICGIITIIRIFMVYNDYMIFIKFIFYGLSVLFTSIAYSIEPYKLAYNSLGELIVSYVLTFATPIMGCIVQNGTITIQLIYILIPLFINNAIRMIVMNIPDKDGDKKAGKITSVVLLEEEKSIQLINVIYLINYIYIIPNLQLHNYIKYAYLSILPLRWWQSLRLNKDKWWDEKYYYDSIPFVESLTVLFTGIAITIGSYLSL